MQWASFKYWVFALVVGVFLPLFFGCAGRLKVTPQVQGAQQRPIRVALADKPGNYTLTFLAAFKIQLEEATYIFDPSLGTMTIQLTPQFLEIRAPQRYVRLPAPYTIAIKPLQEEGMIQWDDNIYPGTLTLQGDGRQCAVVLQLPLERYLLGVLPAEMPTHQAEYLEALKAQAVAARTYARWRMQNPRHPWFDLYGDVRDQVLGPFGEAYQNKWVHQAVEGTQGVILGELRSETHSPAAIRYHSTCGGVFEALKGDSLAIYRDGEVPAEYCSISPLYRWVRIINADQILQNLVQLGRLPLERQLELQERGYTLEVRITQRSVSGRATQLQLVLNGKPYEFRNYEIRTLLGKGRQALPSNYFFILPRPGTKDQFYIFGAGFGHGRGMCQWGAIGQALEGHHWKEILKFYYPEFAIIQEGQLP